MDQAKNDIFRASTLLAVVFAIGFLVVGFLYFKETQKGPEVVIREVIKEVPTEAVKEVPKEIVKEAEVLAEISKMQETMITVGRNYLLAPDVTEDDEVFFGINSFDTGFYLGNEIKELISE